MRKLAGFGKSSIGHLGGYRQTRVTGLDEVLKRLNEELVGVEGRSAKGLIEAAAMIRRETENTPPLTPVDTGNLRASWFVVSTKGEETDPEGYSGKFRKNRTTGTTAATMRSSHTTAIAAARAGVEAVARRGPVVILGYSANYALFVHEMQLRFPGVKWKRENSGGKWLEAAFKTNRDRIIDIVRKNATIK